MENQIKKNELKSTFEFLEQDVYLPGYMTLASADYDQKGGTFVFNLKEPPVMKEHLTTYMTPRGLHICVSQAGLALSEHLINQGKVEEMDIEKFREIFIKGRVKITELYQKFRRELRLGRLVQGRLDITRLRQGKMPILKLDFDFDSKSVHGNLTSIITQNSVPQTNKDILRI